MMEIFVDTSDMKISKNPHHKLITQNLLSDLGITAFDPFAKIGGILHARYPLSVKDPEKALINPYNYVDTGVSRLLNNLLSQGARKKSLIIKITGCSRMLQKNYLLNIGERNKSIARKIIWKNGFFIASEDVGGSQSIDLILDIKTGKTFIKKEHEKIEI